MAKKLPPLERRRRAVEATKQRFAGKAFKLGSNDCVKMARFHLTKLGHKLPSTGHYSTEIEAARQMKKNNALNMAELWDQHLDRIPPASMLIGDIAMPPSDPDSPGSAIGTVLIKVSGHKYLGWHPDHELPAIMDVLQIDAAWRA